MRQRSRTTTTTIQTHYPRPKKAGNTIGGFALASLSVNNYDNNYRRTNTQQTNSNNKNPMLTNAIVEYDNDNREEEKDVYMDIDHDSGDSDSLSGTDSDSDSDIRGYTKVAQRIAYILKHYNNSAEVDDEGVSSNDEGVSSNENKTGRWSREEHKQLMSAMAKHGIDIDKVVEEVKTRTRPQCWQRIRRYYIWLTKANGDDQQDVIESKCY